MIGVSSCTLQRRFSILLPDALRTRLERLHSALHEASALTGEARDAYLRDFGRLSPDLMEDLEQLLASSHDDDPANKTSDTPHEALPSRIGKYRVLGLLGEGGMGTVLLAEEQKPIHRRVALKLIKLGMDTKEATRRFEAERQALAILDHPNVAQVYDAGATTTGRLFFAMEYVPGVPITEYCDGHRLRIDDRLALFSQVCGAVHHAHQKGIIHRDIKPTNILVYVRDGVPIPKVIDFGVAKAMSGPLTDASFCTISNKLIGTPEYMSPEQAAGLGDVDTSSDVYSLGVVLFQLLTGTLPYSRPSHLDQDWSTYQRRIQEDDARLPSERIIEFARAVRSSDGEGAPNTDLSAIARSRGLDEGSLLRKVRGELDWITGKAMERDRTRRYSSAAALAADIDCYRAGEAVQAGPPTAVYRIRKLAQKRKGLVASLGALLLLLVISSTVITALYLRERVALDIAETEERKATRTVEFLMQLLRSASPYGKDTPGSEVDAMLEDAARRLESGALAEFPEAEASILTRIGTIQQLRGRVPAAESNIRAALAIQERTLGPGDVALVPTLSLLSYVLALQGRHAEAKQVGDRAYDVCEKQCDADDPMWLEPLERRVFSLTAERRFAEAEEVGRRILALRQDSDQSGLIAWDLLSIGTSVLEQARYQEAEALQLRALDLFEREDGPETAGVSHALRHLATTYRMSYRDLAAESLLVRARSIMVHTLGPNHLELAQVDADLGGLLVKRGELNQATVLLQEALSIRSVHLGPRSAPVALVLTQLGDVALNSGDIETAETRLLEAKDIFTESPPLSRSMSVRFAATYGRLLGLTGRGREAESLLRPLLEELLSETPKDSVSIRVVRPRLLEALVSQGQTEEADELRRRTAAFAKHS